MASMILAANRSWVSKSLPICKQDNGRLQHRRRKIKFAVEATSISNSSGEGDLERPRWTGDTPISRFVAALIAIPPVYKLMKWGARQVLIRYIQTSGGDFPVLLTPLYVSWC